MMICNTRALETMIKVMVGTTTNEKKGEKLETFLINCQREADIDKDCLQLESCIKFKE